MERDIGSTTIIVAAEHGHSDMVDLLLRNGTSANDATDWGRTSLVYAIMARCPEIAKRLIANGADICRVDYCGWHVLCWACRHGQIDVVRRLLDLAAASPINPKKVAQDKDGWTSLSRAICNNQFACMQELLSDPDIDLALHDNEGDTALSLATRSNFVFFMLQILGTEAYFFDDPVSHETFLAIS